jgi:hypothetical protein
MTTFPTDMHGPSADAPTVSNLYATCAVCEGQWQVIQRLEDSKGCRLCGAPGAAVTIHSEAPDYTHVTII